MSCPCLWVSFLIPLSLNFAVLGDTVQLSYLFSFGDFLNPRGVSISQIGQIYIADSGNNKIKVYSATGDSIREIGGYGWGQLEFDRPYDVFAGTGLNIYVADYGNHRIQRFDKDLNYISTLYTRDDEDVSRRFGYPTSVAMSRLGDLFLLDNENVRVVKVNTLSEIERTFGGTDAGKGRLRNPRQLNVTGTDLVCVLDERWIVLYDNFGNYVRTIGEGLLENPTGMTTRNDSIYVVDRQEIYLFNIDGKLLDVLKPSRGEIDSGDHRFLGLAVSQDRIFLLAGHELSVYEWKKNFLDNH